MSSSRLLIQPSAQMPWEVSVVGVVPRILASQLAPSAQPHQKHEDLVAACTSGAQVEHMDADNIAYAVWCKQRIFVWWVTQDVSDPPHAETLLHPGTGLSAISSTIPSRDSNEAASGTPLPPLLAITTASKKGSREQVVHVYAANRVSGQVFLWIVSNRSSYPEFETSTPAQLSLSPQARATIGTLDPDEYLTSLTVNENLGWIGTSNGRLYRLKQTARPLLLTLVGPLRIKENASLVKGSSSPFSLVNYMFGSAVAVENGPVHSTIMVYSPSGGAYGPKDACWIILENGTIQLWESGSLENETYQVSSIPQLLDSYQKNDDQGSDTLQESIESVVVKGATMSAHDTLHLVVVLNEDRFYYICTRVDLAKKHVTIQGVSWVSRFQPAAIELVGLLAPSDSDRSTSTMEDLSPKYGVFQYASSSLVTVAALGCGSGASGTTEIELTNELDLPMKPSPRWIHGSIGNDSTTNGCTGLSTEGLLIRVRKRGSASISNLSSSSLPLMSTSATGNAKTLAFHLRSAFWHAYQQDSFSGGTNQSFVPPSLQNAPWSDIESAIVQVALLLQKEGDTTNTSVASTNSTISTSTSSLGIRNALEWHISFMKWLREGGGLSQYYKKLSQSARWKLMGIGQELAVHQLLLLQSGQSSLFTAGSLAPFGVARMLEKIQDHVLEHGTVSDQTQWCEKGLLLALKSAEEYRCAPANASDLYDVFEPFDKSVGRGTDGDDRLLWTHSPALQNVMVKQLHHWKNGPSSSIPREETVEVIVRATLKSYRETSLQTETKQRYNLAKMLAVPMIQNDEKAFDLSIEHDWYEGICHLSMKHHYDRSTTFDLAPLIDTMHADRSRFILRWMAKKDYIGRVFKLGESVPALLEELLNDPQFSKKLAPHSWMHYAHEGKYMEAADELASTSVDPSVDLPLSTTEFAVSMAFVYADLAAEKNQESHHASKRRKIQLETKLDLINSQKLLLGEDKGGIEPLHSATYLLNRTVKKLEEGHDASIYGVAGLSIAKGMDDVTTNAARVWAITISLDLPKFQTWIQSARTDLVSVAGTMRDEILEETRFGQLWMAVQDLSMDHHHLVQYPSGDLEQKVMDQLGGGQQQLARFLRALTTVQLQTESLMVGSS